MGGERLEPAAGVSLYVGDSLEVLAGIPDCSISAVVCDPPYGFGLLGKSWDDTGVAFRPDVWVECLRVLRPGGHLLAFGFARNYHRMAVAIEDAGFEIRDSLHWLYGSGFPKSHNVSKAIDKRLGATREVVGYAEQHSNIHSFGDSDKYTGTEFRAEITEAATEEARQWEGWGTALKPSHEPIVLARKPLAGTVAGSVLEHGTGALNIDGCRIGDEVVTSVYTVGGGTPRDRRDGYAQTGETRDHVGRWPRNVLFDEVAHGELGKVSPYFYCAKPSPRERQIGDVENFHPTVKPVELVRYLCRLVCPPGGTILDPFAGSGTTLVAAMLEGFEAVGVEITEEYVPIVVARCRQAAGERVEAGGQDELSMRLFDV